MDQKLKTIEISDQDLSDLLNRGESHFLDFKESAISGKNLQKALVAFSNADGGEIIIGIKDEKVGTGLDTRWEGAKNIEAFNSLIQNINHIKNPPINSISFLTRGNGTGYALRILIEKGIEISYTSDNKVYVRKGAQSLPIKDINEIQALAYAKGAKTYEDALLPETPAEQIVDSVEIGTFLKGYSPKSDPLDFVINQNFLDANNWTPRVVSVLMFHSFPSAVIPKKCAVKISRYETREDDPDREHLADQFTIEGPSYKLIHDTVNKVTEIMSDVKVRTSDGFKSLNYPPEAIWEIIVNAVIHRDYSISDDIHILIYDNRIEIISPGKLPGLVDIDNILDARYSRNPKMVRTLNRYKEPPNKDMGEGMNTTFQKMKEFGLKPPILKEMENSLKVTLPHIPLASPSVAIMEFLRKQNTITNSQARDITGIRSENTMKTEFYKLRDEDLLERVPELGGAKSAWRATPKGKKK